MSEFKHTPGPWRIVGFMDQPEIESDNERDNADETQVFVIARDIGGRIHGDNFDDYSEREANVKLIAAAPDLLSTLERIKSRLEAFHEGERDMKQPTIEVMLDMTLAAIGKAT